MNGGDPTAAWSWGDDKNFPEGRPDRLQMTTDSLAGQSLIGHHAALVQDVAAGSVPLPTYSEWPTPTLTPTSTWKKRSRSSSKSPTTSGAPTSKRRACERKKGIPWTIEEHMLFLMGMERFGRSDWRSISRNVVVTRNPSQVASHAQKFFNRQTLGAKQRKRSSIHDITTVSDARARLPQTESPSTSLDPAFNMDSIPSIHPSPSTSPTTSLNHNYPFAHPSSLHPSTQTHPDAHPFTQPPTMDINIQGLDCLLYEYANPYSDNFHTANSNAMYGVPDQAMFVPGPGPSNQAMFVGGHPNHQAMCVPGPGLGPSNHQAMCVPGPGPSHHQVMCVPGPGPDNKPMFVSGPANQPLYSNYMGSSMR